MKFKALNKDHVPAKHYGRRGTLSEGAQRFPFTVPSVIVFTEFLCLVCNDYGVVRRFFASQNIVKYCLCGVFGNSFLYLLY